jgi:hypothetical protein
MNTCGTVHHNRKEMPYNFNPKHLQLKKKDNGFKVQGNLRPVCWKHKQEVHVLSNMHTPPTDENPKEGGKPVKPLVRDYTTHVSMLTRVTEWQIFMA